MADQDAYCLLESRLGDSRWKFPIRPVEPDGRSRLALDSHPDCGQMPPDDDAANCYLRHPYRFHNHRYWDRFGKLDRVDSNQWWKHLPRDKDGIVEVTPELAIDLSLLHNREFQSQYEQIYLSALSLSGNRFEFASQWGGGGDLDFSADGDGAAASRLLTVSDRLGLAKQLAAGGQFATNIVNSFAFQLGGTNFNDAGGTIVATLTQPLLRGAGRYVRLESLSQAERGLLYDVREFAHFRREFYLDVISSYYALLAQVQAIRNVRSNVQSLELNLIEHQELYNLEMVSLIQVDQVYQQYQSGRASLLSAEQGLANSLDRFKFQLGLPSWVEIKIDEEMLDAFEFTDPKLIELQDGVQELYQQLLQYLPPEQPTDEQLQHIFDQAMAMHRNVLDAYPQIVNELSDWRGRIDAVDASELSDDDRLDFEQAATLARRAAERFGELKSSLDEDALFHAELQKMLRGEPAFLEEENARRDLDPELLPPELRQRQLPELPEGLQEALMQLSPQEKKWEKVYQAVGRRLRERISELFVAQTQARVFAIDLQEVNLDLGVGVQYAIENRLDLMNTKAQVADAFRRVEVTANALKTELDVGASARIATDPDRDNAARFDSSANSYSVNVRLDGPLNRFDERNAYRASQILYQQSRRQYMAAEDSLANTIRADVRQLRLGRINFQIARQQLITAARQVDEAQANLRASSQANSNLTRDLLQALQGLLAAKNDLISNWFNYKITKARLFVDLELLYLDERGAWTNEDFALESLAQFVQNKYGIDAINPGPLRQDGQTSESSEQRIDEIGPKGGGNPNDRENPASSKPSSNPDGSPSR